MFDLACGYRLNELLDMVLVIIQASRLEAHILLQQSATFLKRDGPAAAYQLNAMTPYEWGRNLSRQLPVQHSIHVRSVLNFGFEGNLALLDSLKNAHFERFHCARLAGCLAALSLGLCSDKHRPAREVHDL